MRQNITRRIVFFFVNENSSDSFLLFHVIRLKFMKFKLSNINNARLAGKFIKILKIEKSNFSVVLKRNFVTGYDECNNLGNLA